MSLDFYCRWSSTVAYKEFFLNYLKYWGSIVGGVLLSLEFYGRRHTFYLYAIVFFFICLIFLNIYKFIMLC
jgi:hypothetical protein